MSEQTAIEWTDSTFNPWIGCTKVSPACDHCYAERDFDLRRHVVTWGAGQPRKRTSAANWKLPLRWNKADFRECMDCGWRGEIDTLVDDTCPNCGKHERLTPTRRRVFCASLADVFDNEVPAAWRVDLVDLIAATPNLDWLILTKRIGNVARMWPAEPLPNVWIGATICNQEEADRDIPKLLAIPAAVRFLSIEPMLGPIDIRHRLGACVFTESDPWSTGRGIDWVIVGGESGPNARPLHPDWVRSLRDQCAAAGVPFLFKQWGEWVPMMGHAEGVPVSGPKYTHADGTIMGRAGKKSAGRLLDGLTHSGYPGVAA